MIVYGEARQTKLRVEFNFPEHGYTLVATTPDGLEVRLPTCWQALDELGQSMVKAMNEGAKVYGTTEQSWVGEMRGRR